MEQYLILSLVHSLYYLAANLDWYLFLFYLGQCKWICFQLNRFVFVVYIYNELNRHIIATKNYIIRKAEAGGKLKPSESKLLRFSKTQFLYFSWVCLNGRRLHMNSKNKTAWFIPLYSPACSLPEKSKPSRSLACISGCQGRQCAIQQLHLKIPFRITTLFIQ